MHLMCIAHHYLQTRFILCIPLSVQPFLKKTVGCIGRGTRLLNSCTGLVRAAQRRGPGFHEARGRRRGAKCHIIVSELQGKPEVHCQDEWRAMSSIKLVNIYP